MNDEAKERASVRRILEGGALHDLKGAGSFVGTLIDITPTGLKRDKYTEANIHLMQAERALKEADAIDVKAQYKTCEHNWQVVGGIGSDIGEQCTICGDSRV